MVWEHQLAIPHDLGAWVPVAQLAEWILADLNSVDWTNPDLLEQLRQLPHFEPKALLATMTLAYATGIFGAEEIARHCSDNPEFRMVRPKLPPVPAEMKRFRQENRGVFKWSVANVLTRALKTRFEEGSQIRDLPAGLRRHVIENATERLDIARHLDRGAEIF